MILSRLFLSLLFLIFNAILLSKIYQNRRRNRIALFTTLVSTEDHYKSEDLVDLLINLRCSAITFHPHLEFHLIYGGGLTLEEELFITSFQDRIHIHNFSDQIDFMKSIFTPIFDEHEAKEKNRLFAFDNQVQGRQDGWATAFKFLAWTFEEFEYIIHCDLDVTYLGEINFPLQVDRFMATPHTLKKGRNLHVSYLGYSTHIMILEPNQKTYEQLIEISKHGNFIPFTNSEQDVVDAAFHANIYGGNVNESIPHGHDMEISPLVTYWRKEGKCEDLEKNSK